MHNINLSYVLTTYNKLPYLKYTLERLIQYKNQEEDEIIIIDGGSTDGTKEYLNALFLTKQIDYLISEKDRGEAHGFNKGILIAKGTLIKLMSDDDVFDFDIMKKCKEYLIKNESIDVLYANIGSINSSNSFTELLFVKSYEVWFNKWIKDETKNCFLCGLSLFMRRAAIPYIGILDTSFKHVDFEHSVRLTSKKVNVAFCTGLLVCAVINVDSISYISNGEVDNEVKRVSDYYGYVYPVGPKPVAAIKIKKSFLQRFQSKPNPVKENGIEYFPDYNYILEKDIDTSQLATLYNNLSVIMTNYNKNNKAEFIENIKY